jgi:Spy/CpxP family protein refolding chaperone
MMRTRTMVAVAVCVMCAGSIALAQGQGQGRGRGFGGFQMSAGQLVANEAVAADLKLTDEQKEKVKALPRVDFASFRDLSREEAAKKMEESREASKKAVDEILNADQKKRLAEISLQARGTRALSDAEIAKALALTEEQTKKIKELDEAPRERPQQGADFAKIQEERTAKYMAVLTEEQKKKFEEMQGAKFDTSKLRQFGQGRRPGGNNNNNN